ncbi:hypothetical protein PBI_NESBITT_50 [Streptomyces phage Nesbitt]|uniref:Uncharacterized protein n=1 Tax=Streptomyces phage Nesbitt TaxID=2108133 RepID=A0A2P1JT37_9CAUD|nr:hypothetical protein PBI_NESBITT_50 [Streptomyces phage Nesbitt]
MTTRHTDTTEEMTMELTTPKGIRFAAGEAGREAADAYADLMAERMAVPAVDIRKGDHIRPAPDGPWYPVTADAHRSHMRGHVFIRSGQYLFTRPAGAKVVRHHKETSLQVMRDVAAQYPGAELELPEGDGESRVVSLRDEEDYRFRLEVDTDDSGALVTVSDWEPGADDPEVTTTRFATVDEASAFVKETVEALTADGYREVSQ